MITSVTQVSRTYRTNALWYAEEDAWKQAGRRFGSSSPKAPANPASQRYAFGQFARTAAQELAGVLTTAHQLKQTSDKLLSGSPSWALESRIAGSNQMVLDHGNISVTLKESSADPVELSIGPDTVEIKRQVQELVDRYNGLHKAFSGSTALLKNSTADTMMSKLSDLPLGELGIRQNADGTLKLDTDALEEQAAAHFDRMQRNLRGPNGLATVFTGAAEQLLAQPSEQLLDKRQTLFQSFTNYRVQAWGGSPIRTYLPVPLTGTLLNSYL